MRKNASDRSITEQFFAPIYSFQEREPELPQQPPINSGVQHWENMFNYNSFDDELYSNNSNQQQQQVHQMYQNPGIFRVATPNVLGDELLELDVEALMSSGQGANFYDNPGMF